METGGDLSPLFTLVRHRPVAAFLDFDGVLAAIAPTPSAVELAPAMRSALLHLRDALGGALAVVSGRSLGDIDRLIGTELAAAGDHGNERRRADGHVVWLNPIPAQQVTKLADGLRARTASDSRLIVEAKASAVALHYRLAPEQGPECEAIIADAVQGDPTWSLVRGKMVIEARASGVDKGAAVRAFMGEPPFRGRAPVVLGDDVTDEDAFAAAEGMGGVGVKVGEGSTLASLRIADQGAVLPLLLELAGRAELSQ